jgi:hypothetical protein
LPGNYIPKHVCSLIRFGRVFRAFSADRADGLCFLIGYKGKSGKANGQEKGQKEPFVDKYLSHFAWFIGFDEGRKADVTGLIKKFL